jgi:hypothetical protein
MVLMFADLDQMEAGKQLRFDLRAVTNYVDERYLQPGHVLVNAVDTEFKFKSNQKCVCVPAFTMCLLFIAAFKLLSFFLF